MPTKPSPEVERWLDDLPEDRQEAARAVVAEVRAALPEGYAESMTFGMPTWEVPLERYPDTYNGKPLMYAAFAAQKRHYALYLMAPYQQPEIMARLEQGFEEAGQKLDMGKSCVRFRKLEDLPLPVIRDVVGALGVDAFIESSERAQAR